MGLDNIPKTYPCESIAVRNIDNQIDCKATQECGNCPYMNEYQSEPMLKDTSPVYGMLGTDCWYRGKYGNYMLADLKKYNSDFDSEFTNNNVEVFDPLSGYNRLMTNFNDKFYLNVLNPVSKSYAFVVPETARIGIDNFFNNLMFPVRFTNNLLQLKFQNSTEELGRFLVNTIWGLAGFMDVAKSELQWKEHKEDFGQTLGFYGVGDAIPVVLPLIGPSNLRDIVGLGADSYVSALSTTGDSDLNYKIPKES